MRRASACGPAGAGCSDSASKTSTDWWIVVRHHTACRSAPLRIGFGASSSSAACGGRPQRLRTGSGCCAPRPQPSSDVSGSSGSRGSIPSHRCSATSTSGHAIACTWIRRRSGESAVLAIALTATAVAVSVGSAGSSRMPRSTTRAASPRSRRSPTNGASRHQHSCVARSAATAYGGDRIRAALTDNGSCLPLEGLRRRLPATGIETSLHAALSGAHQRQNETPRPDAAARVDPRPPISHA